MLREEEKVSLWFCTELCRFGKESLYFESEFVKDGPHFEF
jgi:hypothetical protein